VRDDVGMIVCMGLINLFVDVVGLCVGYVMYDYDGWLIGVMVVLMLLDGVVVGVDVCGGSGMRLKMNSVRFSEVSRFRKNDMCLCGVCMNGMVLLFVILLVVWVIFMMLIGLLGLCLLELNVVCMILIIFCGICMMMVVVCVSLFYRVLGMVVSGWCCMLMVGEMLRKLIWVVFSVLLVVVIGLLLLLSMGCWFSGIVVDRLSCWLLCSMMKLIVWLLVLWIVCVVLF